MCSFIWARTGSEQRRAFAGTRIRNAPVKRAKSSGRWGGATRAAGTERAAADGAGRQERRLQKELRTAALRPRKLTSAGAAAEELCDCNELSSGNSVSATTMHPPARVGEKRPLDASTG